MRWEHVASWGGTYRVYVEVQQPQTVTELRTMIMRARNQQRHVSFRAGGYSFDRQALNDDLIISLVKLDGIVDFAPERAQITVEPGVRWETIIRTVVPHGLMPYVVVTSGQTTAGGTLSGNCLSRCSPHYGKEGHHIVRFKLLTVDGEILECTPTEHADLFYAVIGGLGYLGAVIEITYDLLRIDDRRQVTTELKKCDSLDALVMTLQYTTDTSSDWDAIYAIAFFGGSDMRGLVLRSRYSTDMISHRLLLYRTERWLLTPLQILLRSPWFNQRALNLAYRWFMKNGDIYVDDIEGYTFFMDHYRRASKLLDRLGFHPNSVQQTFIIPSAHFVSFLRELAQELRQAEITPNMFDILFLPADKFVLSPTNGRSGYAVSVACEDVPVSKLEVLHRAFEHISHLCVVLEGRVSLVKNVHASSQQLYAMYGRAFDQFIALKQQMDPTGVFHNHFYDHVFGARTQSTSPDTILGPFVKTTSLPK